MRIAIYHNIPDGGAKRSLFHVIKLLTQHNHTVELYTFDIEKEQSFPLAPHVRKVISKPSPVIPTLAKGHPLIINNLNILRQKRNLRCITSISQEFAHLINTGGYDIAFITQCQYFHSPNILRFLTIPTTYYCHEPFRKFYEPPISYENPMMQEQLSPPRVRPHRSARIFQKIAGISYWFSQYGLKCNDQANMRSARSILTNSYFTREYIFRVYAKFARVNYWGVDVEQFRPLPEEKKEHIVLAIGRYYPIKQHHFVLQSLSYIPENKRPGLIIIGNDVPDYTYKTYLEKLAQHLHVSLRLLDNISEDELVGWYNRAKVVVFPPILEPFGFVPLEAMSCQTPVVGVREGGIRETIIDGVTGFLTERDEKAFGEGIYTLLQDETLRQKMGANGRVCVLKNWTWEKSVTQLLQHIRKEIENTR